MEQLSGRSVDGSESNSSQWELELQASVERLNTLPIKKLNTNRELENSKYHESGDSNLPQSRVQKSMKNDDNESRKLNQNLSSINKKPLTRTDSTTHHQSWNSLSQSPTNSGFNKSETFSTQAFSKSLNNSLVNIGNLIFKKNSVDKEGNDAAEKPDGSNKADQTIAEQGRVRKKITVDMASLDMAELTVATSNGNKEAEEKNDQIRREKSNYENGNDEARSFTGCDGDSDARGRTQGQTSSRLKALTGDGESNEKKFNVGSYSSSSSPVRPRTLSKSKVAKSYENNLDRDFVECPKPNKPSSKTSSVKELPLLSIIQSFPNSRFSKDRSSSMTDLADKQNLKNVMDPSKS